MSETELSEDERAVIITTITLDVSSKHLNEVPKTIKNFTNIEFLYISMNQIRTIPDGFFAALPQLKWLDLRNNRLIKIPANIGEHRQLRTLLVQSNLLTELPIELGNIPTITGLNIADNPIEYPPPQVIKHGTQDILIYLRTELQRQNLLSEDVVDRMSDMKLTDNDGYIGSGDEGYRKVSSTSMIHKKKSHQSSVLLDNKSATLHRVPHSGRDKKWTSAGDLTLRKPRLPKPQRKMFRSANPVDRVRASEDKIKKVMLDYEKKRLLAKKREENSRTEMIMQRMRDRDALKEWRQENHNTSPRSPPSRNVEILKQTSMELKNEESLQERIQKHAVKLREYHQRNENDSDTAKNNLDEVQDIQDDINRLKNEYRFTAFTGELI